MDIKNCKFLGWSPLVKIIGLLVVCAIVIVALLQSKLTQPNSTIQVIGQGRSVVVFDTANADIQISTINEKTADAASETIAKKMEDVQKALDTAGIPQEDRQVTGLTVIPQMTSDPINPQNQKIGSYGAAQQLSVVITNIGENAQRVKEVIAAVTKAGASQISPVRFSASNIEQLRQQARLNAAQAARRNAADAAQAAGVKLSKVTGWYESTVYSPDQSTPNMYGYPVANQSSPPLFANFNDGRRELIIEVTLSYEIH